MSAMVNNQFIFRKSTVSLTGSGRVELSPGCEDRNVGKAELRNMGTPPRLFA